MGLENTSVEGFAGALRMIFSGNVDTQLMKDTLLTPQTNQIMSAFAGGTVGVMSSVLIYGKRVQELKEKQQCCYCRGAGTLPCGQCYTIGAVPTAGMPLGKSNCEACDRRGYITCEHCRGTGRADPLDFSKKTRSQFFLPDDDEYYDDKTNPFI
ncbi:hypothetical protein NDN08_004251 [Rhodosorus marinus]|uniref:Uncharacterized protein n=1 Tax=Rhodosorus marinus TaxID=101924 RepID=A0AAV8UKR1_9RHOD|nr:hypothetical protein NDN08_004251 [Rhodosorus marinus]